MLSRYFKHLRSAPVRPPYIRRFNSSPSPLVQTVKEYDPLHEGDKFAQVPNRGVLMVEGPESVKFLQGLITNHMPKIERGGNGFYAGFLTPQGRVLFDVFIYPQNIGNSFPHFRFLIEGSTSVLPALLTHLRRYKVRSKVNFLDVSGEYNIWSIWGPKSANLWWQKDVTISIPVGGLLLKENVVEIGCKDSRMPGMGWRVVMPTGTKPILPENYQELPAIEYTMRRLLHGIPEGPSDFFHGSSLPLESNFDFMCGVDFRKGCYVGQELTIRTYHTGVTRKRIVPVEITQEGESLPNSFALDRTKLFSLPLPQTDIAFESSISKGRIKSIGKFCGGIHNVGLALMRLEHVSENENEQKWFPLSSNKGERLLVKPRIPAWWPRRD